MTPKTTERLTIDGPAGALELVLNQPDLPKGALRGVALVCHPHPLQGGTLDNKVAQTLAKTFFALGYASVRLNFRGVGDSAGAFAEGIGETEDVIAVIAWAKQRLGNALPVVLAGFSFGAYVQTRVAQSVAFERMVLVGPAVGRFPLATVPAETIVIHGEEDDVVPLAKVFEWARPQALPVIVFPGCGHFFHGRLVHLQKSITGMWQGAAPPLAGA